MEDTNSFKDEVVELEPTSAAAEEEQPVKAEDENWKRYVESAWWWGWYT